MQNNTSNSTEYDCFPNVEQTLDLLIGDFIIKLLCLVCYERCMQKYSNDQFMSVQQWKVRYWYIKPVGHKSD